ncbi:MAG TPA: hypothetical protein VLA36_14860 [Longimicrobiales bacterium]|nr:hypothetical protein [Longimicrobiales bacterium]
MKIRVLPAAFGAAFFTLTIAGPTAAQQSDSARVAELERRLEAVTREIERLSLGRDVVEADTSVLGFGPAASKVYRVNRGVSIGGYGEVLYENYAEDRQNGDPSGVRDVADALRAIVYFGYKFSDRLLFNSEIEIEHADEAYLEFAYVDYMLRQSTGIRAGLLLAPLGLVNELHEPPVFLGTERSVTESRIIPTTWRENGIGLFGGNDMFAWRGYLMTSLNSEGFGSSGLRGGRQKGSKALAESLGVAGRLDYLGTPGLLVGASIFSGPTGQGRELDGHTVAGGLLVWDLHLDYEARGWDLRALLAGAKVKDAAQLNELNGLTGAKGIGEEMLGWYAEAGYDVLSHTDSPHRFVPFLSYERVDTQRAVAEGFTADPATDLSVFGVGAAWKPAPQVVAKLGYQIHENAANTGVNQWNVQLGWIF